MTLSIPKSKNLGGFKNHSSGFPGFGFGVNFLSVVWVRRVLLQDLSINFYFE